MNISLGDHVRDTITGFCGVAVARHQYLHGCIRFTVQPPVGKESKLPESQTFDEPQLEVIKKGSVSGGARETGGPMPYMPKPRPGGYS